ncbi:MAG: addiction module toxin RelE [Rhodospirillaceae bacterium]|nr:addiction module toxin RelE [Rhodospirillaceae bacterium]|tara:strand:- start:339 stop:731 length:393 start_codon:yes stop_codon:yes gene_type:complete
MSVFKTKTFARFARKAALTDDELLAAAVDVADGHWDADLGGGVFKQRVARKGGGKSGGHRTIILFKAGRHSFFVHGFAKNQKANVSAAELKALKALAKVLLGLGVADLDIARRAGEILEVTSDGEEGRHD